MKRGTRIVLGIVLTVSMVLAGLIVGAWLGGTFLVSQNAGLAGAAEVIWYGLLGAIIFGIIGFILSRKLDGKPLVWTAILLGPVGLAVAIVMIRGYSQSQKEMEAHLTEAYRNLPPFTVTMVRPGGDAFEKIEIQSASLSYVAQVGGRTCSAQISGEEKVKILTALRDADVLLYNTPNPCSGTTGAPWGELDFTIQEAKPPVTQRSVKIDQACLSQFPVLEVPFEAARKLLRDGDFPQDCG
ncbi:MAG: hypothetical protein ACE363_09470 [Alphaproteobacteria bacterium]